MLHQFSSKRQLIPTDNDKIEAFCEAVRSFKPPCQAHPQPSSLNFAHDFVALPQEVHQQILDLYNYIKANTLDNFKKHLGTIFTQCLANAKEVQHLGENEQLYLAYFEFDDQLGTTYLIIRAFRDGHYSTTPNLDLMADPSKVIEFIATFNGKEWNLRPDEMAIFTEKQNKAKATKTCILS